MKRGSNLSWRTMVGVGVDPSWRNTEGMSQHRIVESRAGRPCSVGIRSERVEAVEGAADRTTWTAVVGLADETSARGRLCGVSLVRSSRRQPSTTACPGGDDLPQGGVAAFTGCVAAPPEERTLEIVTCETENGL